MSDIRKANTTGQAGLFTALINLTNVLIVGLLVTSIPINIFLWKLALS